MGLAAASVVKSDVQLESFDSARDEALLAEWLTRPHVRRWWGDPADHIADARERPERGGHAAATGGAVATRLR